ncbi:MAG: PQQ-dependent sugar dehydrogenase [Pseudomonadota bacterium]
MIGLLFATALVQALPPNFEDTIVWSGLDLPTAVRFAPNGQVFIAEKKGIIKVFDSVDDPTPTIFADLTAEVHDYHDHGLLALAIDPDYPAKPYVYAFYSVDAPVGTQPPFYNDTCLNEDCPSRSRLVLLTASGSVSLSKTILMEGWCHDYPWHSTADLAFGSNRILYVSHGDGASFNFADYGQVISYCGDPTLQGGSLRSQDLYTDGDPVSYDGTVLRIDPDTGEAAIGNPLGGGDPADDAIIANGLRNPFRMSVDTETGRLWIGDVGWNDTEEVDTVADPLAGVSNFGWPCYEGAIRQPGFDALNLPICESLYSANSAVAPYMQYGHLSSGGAISGIALYRGANFPVEYRGALFIADYTQGWIKVMTADANGLPNPANPVDFLGAPAAAVDLQVSPAGHLFYADIYEGEIHRVKYNAANSSPTANIVASAAYGALPLSVGFTGAGSTDPDAGDTLSYSWDLNGDGLFGDSTVVAPNFVYTNAQVVTVRLRVTDSQGHTGVASYLVDAGNTPPVPTIVTPGISPTYAVGEVISFSGGATDAESGILPPSALNWKVVLHHCAVSNPSNCHEHFVQDLDGIASGTFTAPDHEFPVYLELRLTARTGTLTAVTSIILQPRTTTFEFQSIPSGLLVGAFAQSRATPFTRQVVIGGQTNITAPSPQTLTGVPYAFTGWSDGGAQSHVVVAGETATTFTASFAPASASCTLAVSPTSVPQGISATLSWTTSNSTGLSIDQGVGNVTPLASGSRTVAPVATVTYTGSVSGPVGNSTCSATITVTPPIAETLWNSHDVMLQLGTTQGTIAAAAGVNKTSVLEFYESTDAGGVAKGQLFTLLNPGVHPNSFNNVENFWSSPDGPYPYVGKSTVNRGADTGESNAVAPLTARDLQLHPPDNAHLTVAAFRVPENGTYSVSGLAARRVDGNAGYTTRLRLFNAQGVEQANLQATSRTWTRSSATYNLGTLTTGSYIYFAMDRDGDFFYDATEIAWQIRVTNTGAGQSPICGLSASPASIVQGSSSSLSWSTGNATALSITPGIGAVPVAGGASNVTPTTTTTYTGAVSGPGGVASCSTTIVVTPPPPPPLPTCTLAGVPASIIEGNSATLSWTSNNASSLSINQGIGSVTPVAAGSQNVTPAATLTYTGTVAGPGGGGSCSTTLVVTPPPPPQPASCTLTVAPTSITQGSSATLSWTTSSATGLTINQGIGSVTPLAAGSRTVTPAATLTYTGSVTGTVGDSSCAATLTVTAPAAETLWNSYDVVSQAGGTQGSITAAGVNKTSVLEFYESTNNGGVAKGVLFNSFTTGAHPDSFNKAERLWGPAGQRYPYVGKSTVNRGADTGESNAVAPLTARDLQLHPPDNAHLTVAAFRVPENGTYSVSGLAVRRVDANAGYTVRLRLFNAHGVEQVNLQSNSRAWVRSGATYNLGALTTGSYIYFAVDRDGDYYFDATEIAWQIRATP